jgi:hypothetical protein
MFRQITKKECIHYAILIKEPKATRQKFKNIQPSQKNQKDFFLKSEPIAPQKEAVAKVNPIQTGIAKKSIGAKLLKSSSPITILINKAFTKRTHKRYLPTNLIIYIQ